MKTDKIREALEDLEKQRDLVDTAIKSLQTVLVQLNGHSEAQKEMPFVSQERANGEKQGYVDLTVQLLQTSNRPMHMKKIWDQIRILRNNPHIKRQAIETTLLRHISSQGDKAKLRKIAPATYALPPAESAN